MFDGDWVVWVWGGVLLYFEWFGLFCFYFVVLGLRFCVLVLGGGLVWFWGFDAMSCCIGGFVWWIWVVVLDLDWCSDYSWVLFIGFDLIL